MTDFDQFDRNFWDLHVIEVKMANFEHRLTFERELSRIKGTKTI